jgi:hypothetical protein
VRRVSPKEISGEAARMDFAILRVYHALESEASEPRTGFNLNGI